MESTTAVTKLSALPASVQEKDPLICAAQQGDVQAYRALYEQYCGRVFALCYRLTADRTMAEDATQEVFIQVWQKLANYSHHSRFSTWLHSVTANITISYMRKQKGWWQRMLNIDSSGEAQSLNAPHCSSEIDLETLIVQLPERARVVFVLHAIEGYRHQDIARMLGIASGTSKAQFHRARQLLTQWIGGAEHEH